jgi:hypothetical protein
MHTWMGMKVTVHLHALVTHYLQRGSANSFSSTSQKDTIPKWVVEARVHCFLPSPSESYNSEMVPAWSN